MKRVIFMHLILKKKGLKVRYSRPGEYKRDYRAIRIMAVSSQLKMKQRNEEECTIEKYVKNKYRYQLRLLDYLCLYVGNPENKVYLPEEAIFIFLKIYRQQSVSKHD